MLVLNEVTIDRGISSYLTNLECYCDNSFVTCVQGDGLILSTTSGSTAYSLAAGGSMVHPQVRNVPCDLHIEIERLKMLKLQIHAPLKNLIDCTIAPLKQQ